MASKNQELIRGVLREHGPLTVDEILARLAEMGETPPTRSPTNTVRNALQNDALCGATGDGRYVYVPTFARGAAVRVSIEKGREAFAAALEALQEDEEDEEAEEELADIARWLRIDQRAVHQVVEVGAEVVTLFGAAHDSELLPGPPVTLSLDGGPAVTAKPAPALYAAGLSSNQYLVHLPEPFWEWWKPHRRRGASALIIRCIDAEARQYTAAAEYAAPEQEAAQAARNAQLREAAASVLHRTRGLWASLLARRLLARGVYHGDPPPDDLLEVLFGVPGPFCVGHGGMITYRPEMTPAMRRVFAPRLEMEAYGDPKLQRLIRRQVHETAAASRQAFPYAARPAQHLYRIKIALQWRKSTWRAIEILDNQTFHDLHHAIRGAFGWDDDHLYAFFMSGQRWDRLTEIVRPYDEAEPPTGDEVTLANLELQPGQKFLYIFDFGDELRHELEVQSVSPAPAKIGKREFPRIVETHGKAPPQYPSWDGE
ncbi:MAG: plasmid pRiA4b ORF-3 family protein [Chloroflexi bacterium]|nr:plasmid pRiA4b ORF-3 family protein [Chloroflexota bacterium]